MEVIDRTEAPLPVEEMNSVRSMFGSSHKKCSKCGKILHIKKFHLTKRKKIDDKGEKIYHYRRADCNDCRKGPRKAYYKKHKR